MDARVATPSTEASIFRQTETLLSVGLLGVLVVLIIPLPTMLLDTFLAANISISIVILLITLNITQPLEISVFPSLLLLLTLARLSLNVATTRDGDQAIWYGDVVEVLLDTDSHTYYQIAVNPSGAGRRAGATRDTRPRQRTSSRRS